MARPSWRAMRSLVYAWLLWGVAAWAVMIWLGPAESAARLIGAALFTDYDVYYEQLLRFDRAGSLVSSRWYYPPFAAVVFWPLRWLSRDTGALCWACMQALAIAAFMRACFRLLTGWPRLPRTAAALGVMLCSYPVCCCVAWGQVGVLVTVLALASLQRERGEAGLGAAGALKIYPLLYALGSVVRLDLARLARLAAWVVLLAVIVPVCWLGPTAAWELFRVAASVAMRARGPRFDTEQTLDALIMRLFYARSIFDSEPHALLLDLPQPLAMVVSLSSTCAVLAYALWRTRARSAADPLAISAVLIASCLLIKPGWVHYWVALPYAQTALLSRATRRRELAACAASSVLSSLPLLRLLQPTAAGWLETWGVFPVSGLCVLIGVCERAARGDQESESSYSQMRLQLHVNTSLKPSERTA